MDNEKSFTDTIKESIQKQKDQDTEPRGDSSFAGNISVHQCECCGDEVWVLPIHGDNIRIQENGDAVLLMDEEEAIAYYFQLKSQICQ